MTMMDWLRAIGLGVLVSGMLVVVFAAARATRPLPVHLLCGDAWVDSRIGCPPADSSEIAKP